MTRAWLLPLLLVLLVTTGCVAMPSRGPVVESEAQSDVDALPGISFDPRPPQPGESGVEVVSGFLEAMKATPSRTNVARQFLSERARESWAPERRILTYADLDNPSGGSRVVLGLSGVDIYDERGAWRSRAGMRRLAFRLVREGEEWRIDEAPDALIVPDSWFADWYQRVSTYYFDPTGGILVPEAVHVPRGDQEASALVRSLLLAPEGTSSQVLQTHFPPGTGAGLSVPISSAGVAEVNLEGDPSVIDDDTAERMLAQLVWTLRELPRIRAVRLRVGDRTFVGPNGDQEVNLDLGWEFDPVGPRQSRDLFGLQDGRLVRGDISRLEETIGPLGAGALGVRAVSTDLAGLTAAAVSDDGSRLLTAPVSQADVEAVEVLSGGVDLQAPAWDHLDRMWTLDRNRGSARVLLVVGTEAREVEVPGITGQPVDHVLVSRDGTRLVASRRRGGGGEVVVARIRQERTGRVTGVGRATPITPASADRPPIRGLSWRSPTTVSVLTETTADLAHVRTIAVDGAPGEFDQGITQLRGRVRTLVTTPLEGADAFALTGRSVADLGRPDRVLADLPSGLRSLIYAG